MNRPVFAWTILLSVAIATPPSLAAQGVWVGSWATSPTLVPTKDDITAHTFRSVAHLSLGGSALRIVLSNQFGTSPLHIGAAHTALSAGMGKIQGGTDHPLLFNQQPSVTIPPGSIVLSDPVPMAIAAFADLAISVYIPQQTIANATCHPWGLSTTYVSGGDQTEAKELRAATTQTSTCFLQSVIVRAEDQDSAAVVALGDSITDGAYSTLDANRRYPDALATRLQANKKTSHLAVLNEGISGGRVLYDGHGPSVLARFDSDVLAQPGVRYVIYQEGINDIGQIRSPTSPEKDLAVGDLIFAAMQLVTRAHLHGVKVIGATLLPFGPKNAAAKPEWIRMRQMINQYNDWVRNGHEFDAVADFNQALADPQSPETLLPAFDSGDHTHPNDAGYKAMAAAVDLDDFVK